MGEVGRADVFRMRQLARRCRIGLAFLREASRVPVHARRMLISGILNQRVFACYPNQYANPRNVKRIDRQMMLTIIIVEQVRHSAVALFRSHPDIHIPHP